MKTLTEILDTKNKLILMLARIMIFMLRLVCGAIWLVWWSLSGLFSGEETVELFEDTLEFISEVDG